MQQFNLKFMADISSNTGESHLESNMEHDYLLAHYVSLMKKEEFMRNLILGAASLYELIDETPLGEKITGFSDVFEVIEAIKDLSSNNEEE